MDKELEEAAKKYSEKWYDSKDELSNFITGVSSNSFKHGAKYQAERMYREEEVFDLLNKLRYDSYDYGMGKPEFIKWFENHRKIII